MKYQILAFIGAKIFLSGQTEAFSVETTARKSLGKKSFIQKQERGLLKTASTPDEIKNLAMKYSSRNPGSKQYRKAWNHWLSLAVQAIQHDLSNNLPTPADKARFENLFFRLGVAADIGVMPSFSDPSARSAYALEFLCRARSLADLFLETLNPSDTFPNHWIDAIAETPMLGPNGFQEDNEGYNIVSIAGGPGFDFVAAALAAEFCSHGKRHKPINTTVFDYEEGWHDLVDAMEISTKNVLQGSELSCNWGGKCDITKSLSDRVNSSCLAEVGSTQMFVLQYCVAENINLLRDSDYIFFRDLFEIAEEGSLFVFTEVTPRVWSEFYRLIDMHCTYMQITFNRGGQQLLLRKDSTQKSLSLCDRDAEFLSMSIEMARDHEKKINSGFQRQQRKIRT